jgi:uncharacterized protein YdeI (YjbR/CyaY-like superfamily)
VVKRMKTGKKEVQSWFETIEETMAVNAVLLLNLKTYMAVNFAAVQLFA